MSDVRAKEQCPCSGTGFLPGRSHSLFFRLSVTLAAVLCCSCARSSIENEARNLIAEAEKAVIGASTVYMETVTSSTSSQIVGERSLDPPVHNRAWYAGNKFNTLVLGHPQGANNQAVSDGERMLEYFPHLDSYWFRPAPKHSPLKGSLSALLGVNVSDISARGNITFKQVSAGELSGTSVTRVELEWHDKAFGVAARGTRVIWFSNTQPPLPVRVQTATAMRGAALPSYKFGTSPLNKFDEDTSITFVLNSALTEDCFYTIPPPGAKQEPVPQVVLDVDRIKAE